MHLSLLLVRKLNLLKKGGQQARNTVLFSNRFVQQDTAQLYIFTYLIILS